MPVHREALYLNPDLQATNNRRLVILAADFREMPSSQNISEELETDREYSERVKRARHE